MSKSYREQCVEAKAIKSGIVEPPAVGGKSIKPRARPFVLECLSTYRCDKGQWRKWKAYRTRDEAQKVLEKMSRELKSYGWRISETIK